MLATGDRGLAGAFNTNIVRAARKKAEELEAEGKKVLFYIVGRKGRPVIQRVFPKAIIGQYDTSAMKAPAMPTRRRSPTTSSTASKAASSTSPTSPTANSSRSLAQEPTDRPDHPGRPARTPTRTRKAHVAAPRSNMSRTRKQSSPTLLPRNIAVQIYRALLENAAGFYGSQMTAMDNATRNAGDMINKLSIQYNRQRQAAITTELVEIISGAEAL